MYSATHHLQDPHYIEARPSLIAQFRNADVAVCTWAELEAGWLPMPQVKASNATIQNGNPACFMPPTTSPWFILSKAQSRLFLAIRMCWATRMCMPTIGFCLRWHGPWAFSRRCAVGQQRQRIGPDALRGHHGLGAHHPLAGPRHRVLYAVCIGDEFGRARPEFFLVFRCLIASALWVERGIRHGTAVMAA